MANISRQAASRRSVKGWATRTRQGQNPLHRAKTTFMQNNRQRARANEIVHKGNPGYELKVKHPVAHGAAKGAAIGFGANAIGLAMGSDTSKYGIKTIGALAAVGAASGHASSRKGGVNYYTRQNRQRAFNRAQKKSKRL